MEKIQNVVLAILIIVQGCRTSSTPERAIDERLQIFDSKVEKLLNEWDVPGVAIGIIERDEIIFLKGYGLRDIERELSVTVNTLFPIASTTKAMTSFILCKLVEEDLLDLDEPVINYLPSFRLHDDILTKNLTLRDMLCHRSGLPGHDLVWVGSDLSRADLITKLRYLEPSHGLRETWQYQNMMYMTAGYLAGYITNSTWEELVIKYIFVPLNMNRSTFSIVDSEKENDFSYPYISDSGNTIQIPFRNTEVIGPAGSVNSCVKDMCNWLIMQINGGKFNNQQIISEKLLKEIHTPYVVTDGQITDEFSHNLYGLGWNIRTYRDHLHIFHSGGIDGFGCRVSLLPNDSIGIVVLLNMHNSILQHLLTCEIMDCLLDLEDIDWNKRFHEGVNRLNENSQILKQTRDSSRIINTAPSHDLVEYTGTYYHPAYGNLDISLHEENLLLDFHAFAPKLVLQHYHHDVFTCTDEIQGEFEFYFLTSTNDCIDKISSSFVQQVSDITFTRIERY